MIRGVNRQIIEINDTQSEYFEKAIFFVRADKDNLSEKKLHDMAVQFIDQSSLYSVKQKRRKKYLISRKALWLMLSISTAACVILTISRFF